jgi:hypothetical protein
VTPARSSPASSTKLGRRHPAGKGIDVARHVRDQIRQRIETLTTETLLAANDQT